MELNFTDLNYALKLDAEDKLHHYRKSFYHSEEHVVYLDGNSLGRLPLKSLPRIKDIIESEWGNRLIRSWNENWIQRQMQIAAKIAKLIGAEKEEVIVGDSTSVNLFKLVIAALHYQKNRHRVISDELNFPSDLYIIQGVINLLQDDYRGGKKRAIKTRYGNSGNLHR